MPVATPEQKKQMEAAAAKMVAAIKEIESAATDSEKEAETVEKALEAKK